MILNRTKKKKIIKICSQLYIAPEERRTNKSKKNKNCVCAKWEEKHTRVVESFNTQNTTIIIRQVDFDYIHWCSRKMFDKNFSLARIRMHTHAETME